MQKYCPSPMETTLRKRGCGWCSGCGKRYGLEDVYMVLRLLLCFQCWARITINMAEIRPDLVEVKRELFREAEDDGPNET